MLRIVVADDHHLVRTGIRALLEKSGNIQVVGEAATGIEAVALVEKLSPDLIIMDISMPQLDGVQATEQITRMASCTTRVIILSMHSKPNIVEKALRNGAKGYLLKSAISEELILAVQAAIQDHTYLSPGVSGALLRSLWEMQDASSRQSGTKELTGRERQVLQLIAEGHSNSDIAKSLVISVKTVEKHRSNLMAKLGVSDVAGLMREAIKQSLIFVE